MAISLSARRRRLDYAIAAWRHAWRQACEHDAITLGSNFVVFSCDNPYMRAVDTAVAQVNRCRRAYDAARGYHEGRK